jgi:ABC-type multidrug transport system ATPase subunit
MPQLIVTTKGYRQDFDVPGPRITIGRAEDNDVVLPLNFISARWAAIERNGESWRLHVLGTVNPTYLDGRQVSEAALPDGSVVCLGQADPGRAALTLEFRQDFASSTMTVILASPSGAGRPTAQATDETIIVRRRAPRAAAPPPGMLMFSGEGPFYVGRAQDCHLVLDDLRISRRHARLSRDIDGWLIEDLGSVNGVTIDGRRVQRHRLQDGEVIGIEPFRLVFEEDRIVAFDDRRAKLDAHGLQRVVGGKVLLDDVSVSVAPGTVFGIAGVSGAGKTTLLDALSGVRPPDGGRVLVNDIDLYEHFSALQGLIGYTPQQDIVHLELPVRRALAYSARLRLPPDVSDREIEQRVDQVLRDLDLWQRRDLEVRKLSGGQLKRVSIATELIADPGLLFLDEPTSGLDPGTTRDLMQQIRKRASAGRTVILVSHDTESLAACDRMIFLAAGGRVVFTGTPAEALEHFQVSDLADVYKRVEHPDDATHFTRVWQTTQEKIAPFAPAPEDESAAPVERPTSPRRVRGRSAAAAFRRKRRSSLAQFRVLLQRRFEILLRDRRNLLLLLAQAPAIGLLLALVMGADAFGPVGALPADSTFRDSAADNVPPGALASALPLILAATAVWFGAINSAREIVKELPVFLRERQAGLRIAPYMVSKLLVLGLLSAVQVATLLAIVWTKVDIPYRGVYTFAVAEIYVALLLAALAGLAIGLLISASVTNADRAQSLVPIFLIPQIIFVGGPLAGALAYQISSLTITRWTIEGIKITTAIPYRGDRLAQESAFDGADLLLRWGILPAMSLLFLLTASILMRIRGAKV